MNWKQHLESKTNLPLVLFLTIIVSLSLVGKLTQETVEALKWVGLSFFSVRGAANLSETFNANKKES